MSPVELIPLGAVADAPGKSIVEYVAASENLAVLRSPFNSKTQIAVRCLMVVPLCAGLNLVRAAGFYGRTRQPGGHREPRQVHAAAAVARRNRRPFDLSIIATAES